MTWHVWTDGSYRRRPTRPDERGPGAGGWAAVVEYDSEGFVLRGHELDPTSNTRMELVAVRQGLRGCPFGAEVVLHTDAMVVLQIMENGPKPGRDLWNEVAAELACRRVEVSLIVKRRDASGRIDPVHCRAHAFAGAEASHALGNPPRKVLGEMIARLPEPDRRDVLASADHDRRILGERFQREVREWRHRRSRVHAAEVPRPRHRPGCEPGVCVSSCEIGGASVRPPA